MSSWLRLIKNVLSVDSIDGGMHVIPQQHYKIHQGQFFYADYETPDDSPILDDNNVDIVVTVPAGVYPHVIFGHYSEGLAEFYLYENPTIGSNEGTPITPINKNRNSSNTSQLTIAHTPDIGETGTPLINGRWFGGSGKKSSAASETFDAGEWMLKPGNTYLYRITARANNLHIGIDLHYYENT